MMKLEEMTLEKRINIGIQCDSFFLDINETKIATPVFKTLKSILNLPNKYDNEVWMVVTMVGKAMKFGCKGSQLSMHNGDYVKANQIRADRGCHKKLNVTRAKTVISYMEDLGLVEFYLGFKDLFEGRSMKSCVLFSDYLMSLFPAQLISSYKTSISVDEMVEVKDANKQKITKLTRFKGVGDCKKFMRNYNTLLSSNNIMLSGVKCFVQYKQVFSEDLDHGGRIYSFGSFQTMKSYLREYLSINGESCTEVDLRANHISMLYLLNGVVINEDFDCYNINIGNHSYEDTRSLCKLAIMCMINTKTKTGASSALSNLITKDRKSKDPQLSMFPCDKKFCSTVIGDLQKLHHKIKFFDGCHTWGTLQRLDSKVCENVLMHFTNKGEVVLGWHDSWVVRKTLREELVDVIRESWYKVFGTYDNCFIKVEF